MQIDLQESANILWNAWQTGTEIEALPEACRPATRSDAYAVQARLVAHSSQPPLGWKIAATSVAGQEHANVSGPLAGRLLAEGMRCDGSTISLTGNRMKVAEAEFVFAMAQSVAPRKKPYSLEEVMGNVGDLLLGIEIPNSRFAAFATAGETQLIAENACAHEFVLGPRASSVWREMDLAAQVVQAVVEGRSRRYERAGVGANVLGDPRVALTWLINELSTYGMTLSAGQYVTTGTCLVPLEIERGDTVVADFGALGRVACSFRD